MDLRTARIYVAGHRGMVGSAIVRRLEAAGARHIVTRGHAELDLTDQVATRAFFESERPTHVFCAAARVGGILANDTYPADFIRDNLLIQANVIENCHATGVEKLINLGSTCIYPKLAPQPIKEESLLSGPLEPTNEAYAVAKIAGLKMCEAYARQYGMKAMTLMPTNLYGPGDNFDLQSSHVIPALMRKAHEAKLHGESAMVVWGSGTPVREFLHVDDLADAALFCLDNVGDVSMANVGTGEGIAIVDLARLVCEVVGFRGDIRLDTSKPDGTPHKVTDPSLLKSRGWQASIRLRDGLASTYAWFHTHAAR